jgi:hypothetical protein
MLFFSKYRTFSRLAREFEDRILQLETRNAALRRDLAELDEFTHRIARKRYQETYIPPGPADTPSTEANIVPGATVGENRVASAKAAIWAKVKQIRSVG